MTKCLLCYFDFNEIWFLCNVSVFNSEIIYMRSKLVVCSNTYEQYFISTCMHFMNNVCEYVCIWYCMDKSVQ